ncbi:hypothetical protein RIF23_11780 [Lipingzhangella sp. LS1_29]|uniref:Uncharacterized protein n=1 Tax=Lipingzhangella rawalii TaxID=2055835 RepID=A0ABU2H6R9_9ACTN|nr:hypothetical protein [Lipingzhangella rawalii]MDS1270978.1 hypothetical protein [Lipingzhangella rawalii]
MPRRTGQRARALHLRARVEQLETEVVCAADNMATLEEEHAQLDRRVDKLEEELAQVRRERLDTYTRWWRERERHNRSRHLIRRLRRRLGRLRRAADRADGAVHPSGSDGSENANSLDPGNRSDQYSDNGRAQGHGDMRVSDGQGNSEPRSQVDGSSRRHG